MASRKVRARDAVRRRIEENPGMAGPSDERGGIGGGGGGGDIARMSSGEGITVGESGYGEDLGMAALLRKSAGDVRAPPGRGGTETGMRSTV